MPLQSITDLPFATIKPPLWNIWIFKSWVTLVPCSLGLFGVGDSVLWSSTPSHNGDRLHRQLQMSIQMILHILMCSKHLIVPHLEGTCQPLGIFHFVSKERWSFFHLHPWKLVTVKWFQGRQLTLQNRLVLQRTLRIRNGYWVAIPWKSNDLSVFPRMQMKKTSPLLRYKVENP